MKIEYAIKAVNLSGLCPRWAAIKKSAQTPALLTFPGTQSFRLVILISDLAKV